MKRHILVKTTRTITVTSSVATASCLSRLWGGRRDSNEGTHDSTDTGAGKPGNGGKCGVDKTKTKTNTTETGTKSEPAPTSMTDMNT